MRGGCIISRRAPHDETPLKFQVGSFRCLTPLLVIILDRDHYLLSASLVARGAAAFAVADGEIRKG